VISHGSPCPEFDGRLQVSTLAATDIQLGCWHLSVSLPVDSLEFARIHSDSLVRADSSRAKRQVDGCGNPAVGEER
jgi:hypothetical protein